MTKVSKLATALTIAGSLAVAAASEASAAPVPSGVAAMQAALPRGTAVRHRVYRAQPYSSYYGSYYYPGWGYWGYPNYSYWSYPGYSYWDYPSYGYAYGW